MHAPNDAQHLRFQVQVRAQALHDILQQRKHALRLRDADRNRAVVFKSHARHRLRRPCAFKAQPEVFPGILRGGFVVCDLMRIDRKDAAGADAVFRIVRLHDPGPAAHEMQQVMVANGRPVSITARGSVPAKLHQHQRRGVVDMAQVYVTLIFFAGAVENPCRISCHAASPAL